MREKFLKSIVNYFESLSKGDVHMQTFTNSKNSYCLIGYLNNIRTITKYLDKNKNPNYLLVEGSSIPDASDSHMLYNHKFYNINNYIEENRLNIFISKLGIIIPMDILEKMTLKDKNLIKIIIALLYTYENETINYNNDEIKIKSFKYSIKNSYTIISGTKLNSDEEIIFNI